MQETADNNVVPMLSWCIPTSLPPNPLFLLTWVCKTQVLSMVKAKIVMVLKGLPSLQDDRGEVTKWSAFRLFSETM